MGTKECAAEFNKLAAAKGIDAKMVDSGISTKATMQIAEKAVGGNIATLVKLTGKSGRAGGVLCEAVSAIESVINGDTVPQTMGSVPVKAWKAERDKLNAEKQQLSRRYYTLKDEVKEVEQIRWNVFRFS